MAFSMEMRNKALAAVDAGKPYGEIAAILGVSTRWISGLATKRRRGQSLELGKSPGRPRQLDDRRVAQVVAARPDGTLADFRKTLRRPKVSLTTVWRAARRVGYTHKKSR